MVTCFIKKVSQDKTDVGDEVVRSSGKTQIITKACSNCKTQKDRDGFSKKKWVAACKGLLDGKCKECTRVDELIMCCVCNEKKARSAFSKFQKKQNDPTCKECKNSAELQRQQNKAEALKEKAEALKIKAEALQNKAEAAMAKYDRNRSHYADATTSPSDRGVDNRPAWMTQDKAELQRLQNKATAAMANCGRKRSHEADTTYPKKKPRLHTSKGENIGDPKKAVPDRISSGAAAVPDVAHSLTASDMTGMDNTTSWTTGGQDSVATTAFSELTSIRGLGRCVDNRPAWMVQGSCDRLPMQAKTATLSFSFQEERRDHDRARFANIDVPTEIPHIGAAQAVFNSGGRGVDNRPAWMTRSQSLCHT